MTETVRSWEVQEFILEFTKGTDFVATIYDDNEDETDPMVWTDYSAELNIYDSSGAVLHTMSTVNGLIELAPAVDATGAITLSTPLATVDGFTWSRELFKMTITDPSGNTFLYAAGPAVVDDGFEGVRG